MKCLAWDIILQKVNNFEFKKGVTSFVNPYSMLLLQNEQELTSQVDQWCVDGISLVNYINSSFRRNIERYSFDDTSLTHIVFQFAKDNQYKMAVIGTKEAFIKDAIINIEQRHSVKINFWRNGYFKNKEEKESAINTILVQGIEIVICGMGTPYQESFLIDLKNSGWQGYGFTCGGYLHQTAQKREYYPSFFDKLNIRWVYRIIDEPKLFWRYFIDYPIFFLKFNLYKRAIKKRETI